MKKIMLFLASFMVFFLIALFSIVPWLPIIKKDVLNGEITKIVIISPHSSKVGSSFKRELFVEVKDRKTITLNVNSYQKFKIGDIVKVEKYTRKFGFVFYKLQ